MMGKILKGLQGCLVFLDGIIIFSETWEGHQRILEEVFQRIRAAGLKIKRDKCQFAWESVKFLGHIVSERGTAPDPAKVQAVRDFPTPSCFRDVLEFIGMASQVCRELLRHFCTTARVD